MPATDPHAPYITAVADALGVRAHVDHTDYGNDDGDVMLLEAYIRIALDADETDPYEADDVHGLTWRQTTGWGHGREVHGEALLNGWQELPLHALAEPHDVARVVAALSPRLAAAIPDQPDADPPSAPGGLPTPVQRALDEGDIDAEAAGFLAAYWPADATVQD